MVRLAGAVVPRQRRVRRRAPADLEHSAAARGPLEAVDRAALDELQRLGPVAAEEEAELEQVCVGDCVGLFWLWGVLFWFLGL